MDAFHSALIKNEDVDEAILKLKSPSEVPNFKSMDDKKLKQLVHYELKFFIQLCLTESTFMYCLMSNLDCKEGINTQCKSVNEKIEKIMYGDMRREIVHKLIKLRGSSDMKKLKESVEEIYNDEDSFDQRVVEVCS